MISVKVCKEKGVMILVSDRRGMEEEQLEKFKNTSQSQLTSKQEKRVGGKSIGIVNVRERATLFWRSLPSKPSPNLTRCDVEQPFKMNKGAWMYKSY